MSERHKDFVVLVVLVVSFIVVITDHFEKIDQCKRGNDSACIALENEEVARDERRLR
jgi:hypothetical protein